MNSKTLIVIPALNEELALPAVLSSLARELPDVDVLVVDDGSVDQTRSVALAHGVIVASLPFNLGIGAALRTGFRYAVRNGYDRAVQFDADGQHEASEIPKLLAALNNGADFVVGSRFASAEDGESRYQVGHTRGLAMSLLRLLVRYLSRSRFSDTSSGFRAFDRPTLELFAASYPREYMDSVEALVMAAQRGLVVQEVAVRMHERQAGIPSNRSLRLAYNYIRLILMLLVTATFRGSRSRARGAAS